MREEATVSCTNEQIMQCHPLESPCLFDVISDPCEENNLAEKYPNILKMLTKRLQEYNASAIPPGNEPIDERGNPKYFNYTWTNFGDLI
jgi:hypothetical protein